MSAQPEALRLADALETFHNPNDKQAAAELRRLHQFAEDQIGRATAAEASLQMTKATHALKIAAVEAQRDALLEALRLMMDCAGDIATAPDSMLEMALNYDDEETRRQANAFLVARAAIKAVEETK